MPTCLRHDGGMIPSAAGSRLAMAWADALLDPSSAACRVRVPGTDGRFRVRNVATTAPGACRDPAGRRIGTTCTWAHRSSGRARESGPCCRGGDRIISGLAAECAAARTYSLFVALCALPPLRTIRIRRTKDTDWKTKSTTLPLRDTDSFTATGNTTTTRLTDYNAQLRTRIGQASGYQTRSTGIGGDVYPSRTPVPTKDGVRAIT
jgi:hypothetical protein